MWWVLLLFLPSVSGVLQLAAEQKVLTFVAPWCNEKCDLWLEWIDDMRDEYPSITFETHDVADAELFETMHIRNNTQTVPDSMWLEAGDAHAFVGSRTRAGLRRWIADASQQLYAPLFISPSMMALDRFTKRFQASILIIDDEYPEDAFRLALKLPHVGIGWALTDFEAPRQIIVTSIHKRVHLVQNASQIFHALVDTFITEDDLELETTQAIVEQFGKFEVQLQRRVCEESAHEFPATMFFINPAARAPMVYYKRSLVYENDIDFNWLRKVRAFEIEPDRPSGLPTKRHPTVTEVSSNAFNAFLDHPYAYVSLYDAYNPCATLIGDMSERWMNWTANTSVGRMDLSMNDHERLPTNARAGFIMVYTNGSNTRIIACNDV